MNTFPINVEIKKDAPETVELFHKSGVVKSTSLTTGDAHCPVIQKTHYNTTYTNIEIVFGENSIQVIKVVGKIDEVQIGEVITVAYYKDSKGELAPYNYRLHSSKETYKAKLDSTQQFFLDSQDIDWHTLFKASGVKGSINRSTIGLLWSTVLLSCISGFDNFMGVMFIGVTLSAFWFFGARSKFKDNVNHLTFQFERFTRDLDEQFHPQIEALDAEFASLDLK